MNLITETIKEIEREERVNDKDFKETISLLYEANKHYTKALTIDIVSKPFYCVGVKKTTKEEKKKVQGYEYEKWKNTQ